MKAEESLIGKVCPFPVVELINRVENMESGEEITFLIDDPLAAKSIPAELEEFGDVSFSLEKHEKIWKIMVRMD